MLKNLIKIAADLDTAGFKMEADIVDVIIRRIASEMGDQESYPEGVGETGSPVIDMSEEEFASLVASLPVEDEEEDEGGLDQESYDEWVTREQEAGRR